MENEEMCPEALEQVQELQHQLQEVLEGQYPPHDPETHQSWTHHQSQSHLSLLGCSRMC
jgi:hypothetical protein